MLLSQRVRTCAGTLVDPLKSGPCTYSLALAFIILDLHRFRVFNFDLPFVCVMTLMVNQPLIIHTMPRAPHSSLSAFWDSLNGQSPAKDVKSPT